MSIQWITKSINGQTLLSKLNIFSATRPATNRQHHFIIQNLLTKKTPSQSSIALQPYLEQNAIEKNLLTPAPSVMWNQICGLKVKKVLERRCNKCYRFCCNGRWFIRCTAYGRHKQAQMVKDEKNTWTLTSACQHKRRPY